MNNSFIGFLAAAGCAAWIYSKTMRQTGNNTQTSLTVAGIVGFFAFIAMLLLLNYVDSLLA